MNMDPKQKTEQEIQLALEAPYNKQYELDELNRDAVVNEQLSKVNIAVSVTSCCWRIFITSVARSGPR